MLNRLAGYTTFSAGADLARELFPTGDLEEARIWQQETAEARLMFANQFNASLGGARDVREPALLAQRGIMIEASVLLDIRLTLRRATTLKRTLGRMKGQYPLLAEIASEAGRMSAAASRNRARARRKRRRSRTAPARSLAIIRRDLKIAFDRLQTKLQRMISSSGNQTLLQEPLVTMRNGRYVIPLKAEYKGKIPGIVHDSSASGATLWIEPLETVELNNRWRELQLDEEKEIRRILLALTDMVGAELRIHRAHGRSARLSRSGLRQSALRRRHSKPSSRNCCPSSRARTTPIIPAARST